MEHSVRAMEHSVRGQVSSMEQSIRRHVFWRSSNYTNDEDRAKATILARLYQMLVGLKLDWQLQSASMYQVSWWELDGHWQHKMIYMKTNIWRRDQERKANKLKFLGPVVLNCNTNLLAKTPTIGARLPIGGITRSGRNNQGVKLDIIDADSFKLLDETLARLIPTMWFYCLMQSHMHALIVLINCSLINSTVPP